MAGGDLVMEENKNVSAGVVIKEILSYIVWLAAVFAAVQIITNYIGVFSVVDGESMEPTLYNKEYLWVSKLDYLMNDPERFDVVIFPVDYYGEERHFVKRIIGLPGETVYIDADGVIYINNEVLKEGYGKEIIADYTRQRAAEPILLGEDEYFVLGDNRNHSSDSRFDSVGDIHRDDILGKVVARVWPLNKIGKVQ